MPLRDHQMTDEQKNKISRANKGRKFSAEWRRKISKNHANIAGERNPFWGKHHSNKTKKKIRIAKIGMTASGDTRKKMSKMRKGKNNSNWKGGITPENNKIRSSVEYKFWRKSVFIRDNFTCQKCKKSGGYLIGHHINNFADFPELRFEIDNGCTLCKGCHKEFHKKYGKKNNTREQLEEFLINK